MKKPISFFALSLLMSAFAGLTAQAEGVVASQTIEKVVEVSENSDGSLELTYAPADRVAPGETLVYTLNFENTGTESADNIVLTLPFEKAVTYVEGSAIDPKARVEFSADGGKSFVSRSELSVAENGNVRPAVAADVTHVRWTLLDAVGPGESGSVKLQAVLK